MKIPIPTHAEQVALFRHSVVGDLLARELARGELQSELQERAKQRYRPPGASRTRRYSWKTLQRWYHEARRSPMALMPASRKRGFALALSDDQREMLLQMRKAHRSAPVDLILTEAIRNGIVAEDAVSVSTVRRLFRAAGLNREQRRRASRRADVQRRRWAAKNAGDLWHGDVCHLVLPDGNGKTRKVLIHGFLDDASRYFVALKARTHETEVDMLEVLCGALLQHPPPTVLFLDNGSCYRGDILALICQRLGIRLVHAKPHDPEARGKMERAWRTMRGRCTDHLPGLATLHDVNQALWAWLDADYHRRKHASLMGKTPRKAYLAGKRGRPLTPGELARALEITARRQVKKDGTFTVDGDLYEVSGRHLLGRWVTIVTDGLTGRLLRVAWQGQTVPFGPCDPIANRHRKRAPVVEQARGDVPFDPIAGLLQAAREVGDE